MSLFRECERLVVVSFFSIAVLILISIPVHISAAKNVETNFDSVNFDADSNVIDNMYMPLEPGTTFYYEAETEDGLETDTVEVTDAPCNILGVECVEVSDMAYLEDCLIEDTLDWFAQDKDGNVWYLGEDTESYDVDEDCNPIGPPSTEGSWVAGQDVAGIGTDAEAGIVMLAKPKQGLSYMQEFYEEEAEDMANVLRLNATVSTELADYEGCLETKEWTPLEHGAIEHKYYAPGIGLVYVEELKGKTVKVELVDIELPAP